MCRAKSQSGLKLDVIAAAQRVCEACCSIGSPTLSDSSELAGEHLGETAVAKPERTAAPQISGSASEAPSVAAAALSCADTGTGPCAYGIRLSLRQANCSRLCSTAPLMAAAEESSLPAVLAAIEHQHVTHFAAAFRAACQVPKHWLGMQPVVDKALQKVGPVPSLELLSGTMAAMPPKPSSQQDAFMFHVLLTKTEHWAAACEKHHQAVPAAARQRAVTLTAQLFQNAAAPAAVRLIQAFHLTGADLQPALDLDNVLAELLADRRSVKHAMAVLLAFPEKAQGLDKKELFDNILGASQGRAGTDLCRSLPQEPQVQWVEALIAAGQGNAAAKAAAKLGLEDTFPGLSVAADQGLIGRLLTKRKWGIAFLMASKPEQQASIVSALVHAGQHILAQEYCDSWGLSPEQHGVSQDSISAQLEREAQEYVNLPLLPGAVVVVRDGAGCREASSVLQQASALGVDAEWQPSVTGASPLPSLLQVATADKVFIFDLLALENHAAALDSCLHRCLSSADVPKVGVALLEDFRKLHRSFQCIAAFKDVTGVLDLRRVAGALELGQRDFPWVASKPTGRAKDLGLSTLAACTLGRPVNKAMQTSNWRRRPLSAAQLRYAAIDAHVGLRIFQRIWDNVRPADRTRINNLVQ